MEAQSLRGISAGLNSIFRKIYNNMTDQPSFEGSYRLYLLSFAVLHCEMYLSFD